MKTIKLTGTDAIQVRRDGDTYTGVAVVDNADKHTKQKSHRDAWQLIPDPEDAKENAQFAGAMIDGISITNCKAESDGKLQLIFQSDGGCTNVNFQDNTLDTNGKHFISVAAFSGVIKNNRDSAGNLVPIQLFPLRIGGNSDGKLNVYILTFKDGRQYEPVVQDDTLDHVTDHRFGYGKRKNSVYLYNFDLEGYWAKVQERQLTADEMRTLALEYGSTKEHSMKMSPRGVQVLMSSEDVSYDIYLDQAGLPTIGWGHCLKQDEISSGKIELTDGTILDIRHNGITAAQAQALLESDLAPRETAVTMLIDVPLEQHQFDALVHWVFNVGEGAMARSTLRKKLNRGMYGDVPAELRKWNIVTIKGVKQVSDGLVNRRIVEVALWNDDYGSHVAPSVIQPDYAPMGVEEMYAKLDMRFNELESDAQDLREEAARPGTPTYDMAYAQAKERVYKDNSKPPYQSKIIGLAVATMGAYFTNKYGWDVPPEVKSVVEDVIITAGGLAIGAARMWFTNKVLSRS